MFTRVPKSRGVSEFVSDALEQMADFETTEKMPLQEEHTDFAHPDFENSVTTEELDYATVPMALMAELEDSLTHYTKPTPIEPLIDEKFFKFDVADSRPDDYSDSIVVEEEDDTISAQLFNQFFKKA
jgi:hypothetical protein